MTQARAGLGRAGPLAATCLGTCLGLGLAYLRLYVAQGSPGCLRPSARRLEGSFRVDRNLTKPRQVIIHKYGLGLTRYSPGSLSG